MQAFGKTLFMLGVLPYTHDVTESLALMTGVSVVPALLRLLLRPVKSIMGITEIVLDVLAFLAQVHLKVYCNFLLYHTRINLFTRYPTEVLHTIEELIKKNFFS